VKKACVPLFPAYLPFAAEGPTAPLYHTGRILRILPVPDQERFVVDLEAVRRVVGTGSPVEVHPGLQPGALVRITHGPLCGLIGPIQRQGSQCRFWVHVEMFNRSVSVELPCGMLLPEE
jgi:transcription antitermination factor NusG